MTYRLRWELSIYNESAEVYALLETYDISNAEFQTYARAKEVADIIQLHANRPQTSASGPYLFTVEVV